MATESSPYVTLRRPNARPHHRTSGDRDPAQPGRERHGQASPPSTTGLFEMDDAGLVVWRSPQGADNQPYKVDPLPNY